MSIGNYSRYGINITTAGNNIIENDYIGLYTDGSDWRPNGAAGIRVLTSNNRIGGPSASQRNVIAKSAGAGISIEGGTGTTVQGNYIGLDLFGFPAQTSERVVMTSGTTGNLVGGISPARATSSPATPARASKWTAAEPYGPGAT